MGKNEAISFPEGKPEESLRILNENSKKFLELDPIDLKIIDDIENVRKKNNSNWMDILRIAFKFSPKETAKVMSKIYFQDSKISKLSKKLK